jgi:nicotinate-nucleotide pyrophosphorylase (carboxylating)
MHKEFAQLQWNEALLADWRELLRLAIEEDFGSSGDWTTRLLVPAGTQGRAAVVARREGAIAGLCAIESTLESLDPHLVWNPVSADGDVVSAGARLGVIAGPASGILRAERLVLNMLGRLSGIATLTRAYVSAVKGTRARVYDTRKTTPGWRRLEKYAVRCGGGWNHRTGLFEAVLIKDNHLAFGAEGASDLNSHYSPAEAVVRARRALLEQGGIGEREMIVEIEVDTLEQLDQVLPAGPDIVLLDNMNPLMLRDAVARRDAQYPEIELEASGGVNLETIRAIAEAGVDRISIGALTHSAAALDIGLDWLSGGTPHV